jgi:hypothetical protein
MTVYKSKSERLRETTFAEGGTTRMAKPQAAGPAKPGSTGKPQNPAPGAKRASGGPKSPRGASVAGPASAGHTSPVRRKDR